MIQRGTMNLVVMLLLLRLTGAHAWTGHTGCKSQKTLHRPSSRVMYAPSNMPTTETPSLAAQKMLKKAGLQRTERMNSSLQLSQSVLASCDTLPQFPTSHGLLSPETVMRMEQLTASQGHTSEALVSFLKTYKRHGPMSCLPMLSDPDILPHLTNAMRESLA